MTHDPKPFSVNHWGSHPDLGNDDCHTGEDFATLEEARADFALPVKDSYTQWIELDGPGIYELRRNPNYRPSRDDDDEWRRERAMQAGMGLGIDAYNDEMGY